MTAEFVYDNDENAGNYGSLISSRDKTIKKGNCNCEERVKMLSLSLTIQTLFLTIL